MQLKSLSGILGQRKFVVPSYQRGYSWEEPQWKDLFDDVVDVIRSGRPDHYYGTLILRDTGRAEGFGVEQWEVFEVIDGQQRLTTAIILLHEIIRRLDAFGVPGTEHLRQNHIKYGDLTKLDLLGIDDPFFKGLLDGQPGEPDTRSQRRLRGAAAYFNTRLEPYDVQGVQALLQALLYKFKVLDFQVSDPGVAVVIFSTVNDRGKQLSNLDKAKSTLTTYSRFYLQGALDDAINDNFGVVFRSYDRIKTIAEDLGIRLIKRPDFDEDNIFVYHYISYGEQFANWDYDATAAYVLHNFLRAQLEERKEDPAALRAFIEDYVADLARFFSAFERMLARLQSDCLLCKLVKVLDMSTHLYPLAIRLEEKGRLDGVADMLEKTEFRVYEMRGTNARARAPVYRLAADVHWRRAGTDEVRKRLAEFINFYMPDQEFRRKLSGSAADLPAKYILGEYEAWVKRKQPDWLCTTEGAQLWEKLQVDHVLPQNPKNIPPGFKTKDDYDATVDRIGNLVLLEAPLNEAARGLMPPAKAEQYYTTKSAIETTKALGSEIQKTGKFDHEDVAARTDAIIQFCVARWGI